MVIGYYKQDSVSVDALLAEGIKAGAYSDAGWTYNGLISVAKKHGMQGSAYSLASSGSAAAYAQLTKSLAGGPVIASVHYKFDPKSTIPHLVVINSIKNGVVYYNDPAANGGQKQVSVDTFTKAWKMRYIVIRPTQTV
jgi:predicted double-glycine peptidase